MYEREIQTPEGIGGVRFLALLTFAKALVAFLVSILGGGFGFFFGSFEPLSLFLFLWGGIYLVVVEGLWHLKRWAYYVTLLMPLLIALSFVSVAIGLLIPKDLRIVTYFIIEQLAFFWVFLFAGGSESIMWLLIFAIHVLIPAYLLQPRIKKAFGISGFLR